VFASEQLKDKVSRAFWDSKFDRVISGLKSLATNPKLRGTVFLIGTPDGPMLQAAAQCMTVQDWYDVGLNNPLLTSDYFKASSVLGTALHSSNFTDGMVLKTMNPTVKLTFSKKNM
jgi:hypothetical protein